MLHVLVLLTTSLATSEPDSVDRRDGRWNVHVVTGFSGGSGGPGVGVDASWYGSLPVGIHVGCGVPVWVGEDPEFLLPPPTTIGLAWKKSRRTSMQFDIHPPRGLVSVGSAEVSWTHVLSPRLDKGAELAIRYGIWMPARAAVADRSLESDAGSEGGGSGFVAVVGEGILSLPVPTFAMALRF